MGSGSSATVPTSTMPTSTMLQGPSQLLSICSHPASSGHQLHLLKSILCHGQPPKDRAQCAGARGSERCGCGIAHTPIPAGRGDSSAGEQPQQLSSAHPVRASIPSPHSSSAAPRATLKPLPHPPCANPTTPPLRPRAKQRWAAGCGWLLAVVGSLPTMACSHHIPASAGCRDAAVVLLAGVGSCSHGQELVAQGMQIKSQPSSNSLGSLPTTSPG